MVSNFKDTDIDLDDIFGLRSWFATGNQLWGVGSGFIGANDTINRSSPIQVGNLSEWKTIHSSAAGTFFAIRRDETLWVWGLNSTGNLGLSEATALVRSSPTQVGTIVGWKQVSASDPTVLALRTDGTLWSWGGGTQGPLGLNSTIDRSSPVQVGTDTNWSAVSAGGIHSLALKSNGTLWMWGSGAGGSGINDVIARSSPTQIGTDTNWAYIAASGGRWTNTAIPVTLPLASSFSVKTNGTLWSWGNNSYGNLGLNDTILRSSPVQVGTATNWGKLSRTTYAQGGPINPPFRRKIFSVKTDGSLWVWGSGRYGGIGLNDAIDRSSPTQIGSLTNWSFVSEESGTTMAVKTDGTLWSWGANNNGSLGVNVSIQRSSPVQIGTDTNWVYAATSRTASIMLKNTGHFI